MATDLLLFMIMIIFLIIVIVLPFMVNTVVLCRLRSNLIKTFGDIEEKYPEELKKVYDDRNLQDNELNSPYLELQRLKLEISQELTKELPQRKGLTRFTVMSSVIFVIGTTIIYFIISGESEELLKSTLTILTGAFTTIIGFYFGGRAEEIKNEDVEKIANKMSEERSAKKEAS